MVGDDLTLYYGEILLLQFRLLSFVMSLCLLAPTCLLVPACINHIIVMSLSLFAAAYLLVPAYISRKNIELIKKFITSCLMAACSTALRLKFDLIR